MYMIYIGTVIMSCGLLLNENFDACSKVNSSLPANLNCVDAEYVKIINKKNPVVVEVTSYTSYQSSTEYVTDTYYTIPTTTPQVPEFSSQSPGNYIPTIIGVSGIGLALLAGTVGYFANKKLNPKPEIDQPLSDIDNYYTNNNLDVLGPPFRRAYTSN